MEADPEAGFGPVLARATTIDELLADTSCAQQLDPEAVQRRLDAWCRAAASGDWALFSRRLHRDGMSIDDVRARFAAVGSERCAWRDDAVWVCAALARPPEHPHPRAEVAFQDLLLQVVREAERRLWAQTGPGGHSVLTDSARVDLTHALLTELSDLAAPALFDRFASARADGVGYLDFVSDMRSTGLRRLFEGKPVLLRLICSLTRQWIETSHEMIVRICADLPSIREELLDLRTDARVSAVESGLSDPHYGGRSVRMLRFEDGARVVYKPKNLSVDAAWARLIDTLNQRDAPVELRAMRVLNRAGYGWTQFIEHTSCTGPHDFALFYRRAGAWLALFHAFVGVDMHQENIIAAGAHPVPIDLEMVLQAADPRVEVDDDGGAAFASAMQSVIDSVLTVGLLPAYGRHSTSRVFAIGGVHSNSAPRVTVAWTDMNSDAMRPHRVSDTSTTITNLPYADARRASLGDHIDDLTAGFGDYARFLHRQDARGLLNPFADLTVRTIIRPTRFYAGLLTRLRDHRTMDDGVRWSAQADFTSRLANWDTDSDPTWALQRAERMALVDLNVPHFTTVADIARADARLTGLDDAEIDRQIELIRQNTGLLRRASPTRDLVSSPTTTERADAVFTGRADALAATLTDVAVREGNGAAWIALDWLGDSEVSQLVALGPDLYNGCTGIALFLAAHAAVTANASSEIVARAALAALRQNLRGRNPARMARSLGVGAGLGLGSIVYGLTVIADLLGDDAILADAHVAADLFTDDIVAADRRLDVLGGCAGGILGLLKLHRRSGSANALLLAEKCGRRLLGQARVGERGKRTWASPAFGRPLNGMSHGAAGFAYALQLLSTVTGDARFADAAAECLAFEDATFDADRHGWADLRDNADAGWPCKWCYGAPGIGLARIAMTKLAGAPVDSCEVDIERALDGVEHGWPVATDTLCCGTLGSIEFLWEACDAMGRPELRDRATRRLLSVVETADRAGEFRWSSGTSQFNLGLFRGIAGIGYTSLRAIDQSLPNVSIWE